MTHAGKLFVVATPIGNLGDLSPRAVETLRSVDIIAAEDTRHSAKLLIHFNIRTTVVPYHEHNAGAQTERLLGRLKGGEQVALISDAGTPLISDPGYRLILACHQADCPVVAIPGACALTSAVSVSGLPCDRLFFEGFLPARSEARKSRLNALSERRETLVIYESCHRIIESLSDMLGQFGAGRRVTYCRELTKSWETVRQLPLGQLLSWVENDPDQRRGEIVLVVEGSSDKAVTIDPVSRKWLVLLSAELAPAKLAAVGARVTGLKKREIYEWLRTERGDNAD